MQLVPHREPYALQISLKANQTVNSCLLLMDFAAIRESIKSSVVTILRKAYQMPKSGKLVLIVIICIINELFSTFSDRTLLKY